MAGFAAVAAMLSFTLRAAHKQAGAATAMAAGLMLFFFALTQLGTAVEALRSLSDRAGSDAGEDGLAGKAALCGKMLLMMQTLPLINEIGELTLSLIP